jgi:hypothetical protein
MVELKLQALDGEDLAVVSAHCQDAVVRVADLAFQHRERRFVLVCNRFDWTTADRAKGRQGFERRRAGLRFERVRRAQLTGFDVSQGDTVLVLLAIAFEPLDAPGGRITLQFAAGAAIRLDVDYIEAELKDLGAAWSTGQKPDHAAADDAPAPQPRASQTDK